MYKSYISVLIIVSSFVLNACGEEHDAYIGKYQYSGAADGLPKILEIKKENDSYYVVDEGKPPIQADAVSGGLEIHGLLISLSDDESALSIGGQEAKRM